jgi:peptidoglycan/LPS O-acetylase OafA/YrhL
MFISGEEPIYLRPFFSGSHSVLLFFVLSGYVLSLPTWKGTQSSYGKYLTRRLCRIYLPYLGAALFALLVGFKLRYSTLPLTPWFYRTWHEPFTAKLILEHLVFANDGASINTAFWSLRPEMEMSIIFPLVCWILLSLPSIARWGIAILIELIGLGRVGHFGENWAIFYASAFIFGAVLAKDMSVVRRLYNRLNRPLKYGFLIAVVAMFYRGRSDFDHELVHMPGACGVIVLADCSRARQWLSEKFPVYLGNISFSLYLLHGTFLFGSTILLYGRVPVWVIGCVYFIFTFGAAHLYYTLVELPAISLGRKLTRNPTNSDNVPPDDPGRQKL